MASGGWIVTPAKCVTRITYGQESGECGEDGCPHARELYVSGNSLTELALEWAKKANREAYRYECVRRHWPCTREEFALRVVTPAEAGVQGTQRRWIPAFAGMTETGVL